MGRCVGRHAALLMALALAWGLASSRTPALHAQSPPDAASPPTGSSGPVLPRGIFVYSEHLAEDAPQLSQALTMPGVDGLTLLLGWAALEPRRGAFDWTQLDQWMQAASGTGRQVVLAVR